MNVWQLITSNSGAGPGATAWQHLNAQEGGGPVINIGAIASAYAVGELQAVASQTSLSATALNTATSQADNTRLTAIAQQNIRAIRG